jgi:hypothetical protein
LLCDKASQGFKIFFGGNTMAITERPTRGRKRKNPEPLEGSGETRDMHMRTRSKGVHIIFKTKDKIEFKQFARFFKTFSEVKYGGSRKLEFFHLFQSNKQQQPSLEEGEVAFHAILYANNPIDIYNPIEYFDYMVRYKLIPTSVYGITNENAVACSYQVLSLISNEELHYIEGDRNVSCDLFR